MAKLTVPVKYFNQMRLDCFSTCYTTLAMNGEQAYDVAMAVFPYDTDDARKAKRREVFVMYLGVDIPPLDAFKGSLDIMAPL